MLKNIEEHDQFLLMSILQGYNLDNYERELILNFINRCIEQNNPYKEAL